MSAAMFLVCLAGSPNWDIQLDLKESFAHPQCERITGIAWLDGERLVATTSSGDVVCHSLEGQLPVWTYHSEVPVESCDEQRSGDCVMTLREDGSVLALSTSGRKVTELSLSSFQRLCRNPNATPWRVRTGSAGLVYVADLSAKNGHVHVLNSKLTKLVKTVQLQEMARDLYVSKKGDLVTLEGREYIKVQSLEGNAVVTMGRQPNIPFERNLRHVAHASHVKLAGPSVVVSSWDRPLEKGGVKIYDIPTRRVKEIPGKNSAMVIDVYVREHINLIVSSGSRAHLQLFNISGDLLAEATGSGHDWIVRFSPDGQNIAVARDDEVWVYQILKSDQKK